MRIVLVSLMHAGIRPEDEEEHLGLGYLAAVARRDGHSVEIIDAPAHRLTVPKLAAALTVGGEPGATRRLQPERADLIGISVLFQELIPDTMQLVSLLRRAGARQPIVLGGHPPSFLYHELARDYEGFDCIALGEAEGTFADLLETLDGGGDPAGVPGLVTWEAARRSSGGPGREPELEQLEPGTGGSPIRARPLNPDLDSLPFPARDTLPTYLTGSSGRRGGYRTASVLRSRGCYGNCSFCDTRAFYGLSPGQAWRVRSAPNVADEIEQLRLDHQVDHIRFWDDNFMGPGDRGRQAAEELARELEARRLGVGFSFECRVTDVEPDLFRRLKDVGLTRVFLGVEAMTQRQLDFHNKKVTVEDNRRALSILEALGLDVTIGMIMFDPDTTVDELNTNLAFLKESFGSWGAVKTKVAQPWNRLTVYAGTPLESSLREQGRLKGSYTQYDYDFSNATVAGLYASGAALRRVGLPLRNALGRLKRRA